MWCSCNWHAIIFLVLLGRYSSNLSTKGIENRQLSEAFGRFSSPISITNQIWREWLTAVKSRENSHVFCCCDPIFAKKDTSCWTWLQIVSRSITKRGKKLAQKLWRILQERNGIGISNYSALLSVMRRKWWWVTFWPFLNPKDLLRIGIESVCLNSNIGRWLNAMHLDCLAPHSIPTADEHSMSIIYIVFLAYQWHLSEIHWKIHRNQLLEWHFALFMNNESKKHSNAC